ncbi:MAG TPA: FAD-linked oxidase C-terminal domain-containing protein, partial [Bacteroidales bacterium]|nr:FAD-linked oxidase C-terminal domain-containing protein [Bacteroidales bacterium]
MIPEVDLIPELKLIAKQIEGDLLFDNTSRLIYSTDASAYREKPIAVARPKTNDDIKKLVNFARNHQIGLIPRAAGTSLAGQVVGSGIVVDVSRYLTNILEVNPEEKWVRLQPGVILDELNLYLKKYGLFFGPETSTSNRCMIGGMVGNNACGAHSLIYGSTRDHLLSVKAILCDGSEAEFKALRTEEFNQKKAGSGFENKLYQNIESILGKKENQDEIRNQYPDPVVKRRNNGYAIDLLLESDPFSGNGVPFNFCKLIAGSEGTLAFITEIKLNLVPLPPPHKGLICAHFESLEQAFQANLIALKHHPGAIELMDKFILECTKANIEQRKNRFFIKGEPEAIMIVEFARNSMEEIEELRDRIEKDIRNAGYGYYFPLVTGSDINKVWALRKAGLGSLANLPGDAKPVSVIEDTAVNPAVLPDYIADIKEMLGRFNLECVFHAHIATGELHIRPVLNLKDPEHVELFHTVAEEVARIVKKHRGSLSGEHGDGRLRGEFIPIMIGEKNYRLLKDIKKTWDPDNIFNPRKITDTPSMKTSLRYLPGAVTKQFDTVFDFSSTLGFMRLVEMCNGSGDCRKSALIGGTMCPSYMATKDENNTTRARANMLREVLTNSPKKNPFDDEELYKILDLCLSCKGCKSECPSNVDMAKLKAEFLQHYYDSNRIPIRTRLIAYITTINKLAAIVPGIYNWFISNRFLSFLIKKTIGFATKRSMPGLHKQTLRKWINRHLDNLNKTLVNPKKSVYLFVDEFTNFNDVPTGIATVRILVKLGYHVSVIKNGESGRTFISKGLLRKARKLAIQNITLYKDIITPDSPLVGIEPSAILAFRDEYPDLAGQELKKDADRLAANVFIIDEFLAAEFEKGNIHKDLFTKEAREIKLHGHCQQKSVASTAPTKAMLSIPENYDVEEIKSGCCGMAGAFGYEKEHYELSMKVGELVLFPEIRKSSAGTIISAPGT